MTLIQSLFGMAVLLGIAFLLSTNKKKINVRTVSLAFLIQFGLCALVLYVPAGQTILEAVSATVKTVFDYAKIGMSFMFGGLVSEQSGFVFALQVLAPIVFFSSLIAVLYHLKVMDKIVLVIGGALQKILKTSRSESMCATANIFVGQTEAPIVVKPYIKSMSRSELFAVMVGGLSTVAGAVMAGYYEMGIELKYLLAASFMAAPGGLLMAKMILPETSSQKTAVEEELDTERAVNVIDAAANGASQGMMLALNIGAMLLAFVSLIALLNGMLGWFGEMAGYPEVSLQLILGYIFQPLAFVIGVPWHEAHYVGSLLGQKLIINEFVAYMDFTGQAATLDPRSQAIVTFALCGFANLSSIAILLGGLGGLCPERRSEIAELGVRAVAAGTLSNLMSATMAGFFLALS